MFPSSIPVKRLIILKGHENYCAWKFFMKSVLEFEGLDEYIKSDFGLKYLAMLVNEAKVDHAKVKLMIITSIDEKTLREIPDTDVDSAYKIWCFLAKRYGPMKLNFKG